MLVKIVKHNRPLGYAEIDETLYDSRKHTLFIEKQETKAEAPKKAPAKKSK